MTLAHFAAPGVYRVVKHVALLSACCIVMVTTATNVRAQAQATPPAAAEAMVLIKQQCQSCHNPEKHKGGLDLTSREQALKGGENGVVIHPAKADASPLIQVLAADADPHMPPKGQLTAQEIDLLRRWINGGAAWADIAEQKPATRPVVLRGIPDSYHPVLAIAISPDGKRLAAGHADRVAVTDLTTPEPAITALFSTPGEPVYSLAWSPDGGLLAIGGYRHVRLWDTKSAGAARTFDQLAGRIAALAFTSNGHELLAADGEPGSEGLIHQWSLDSASSPTPRITWPAHRDTIASMKLSADATTLVTAGADKLVKIWDRASRKEIAVLEGHAAPVMAVALSADGTQLASAGADKEIRIWDIKTRALIKSLTSSPTGVGDLCWLDGKRIFSASDDGIVRLTNQDNPGATERAFGGAADLVYCLALAPDGKTVYSGCHDGNIYAWDVASGKPQRTVTPPRADATPNAPAAASAPAPPARQAQQ